MARPRTAAEASAPPVDHDLVPVEGMGASVLRWGGKHLWPATVVRVEGATMLWASFDRITPAPGNPAGGQDWQIEPVDLRDWPDAEWFVRGEDGRFYRSLSLPEDSPGQDILTLGERRVYFDWSD